MATGETESWPAVTSARMIQSRTITVVNHQAAFRGIKGVHRFLYLLPDVIRLTEYEHL
jgi:hypothetical protein